MSGSIPFSSAEPASAASSADALCDSGISWLQQQDYDQAIGAFSRAVALQPQHLDALVRLGYALLLTGKPKAALAAYRQAQPLLPEHPVILNGLGNCLVAMGDFSEAAACFEQALKASPGNAQYLYNLATISTDAPMHLQQQLEALYQAPGLDAKSRLHACFALGKFAEQRKDLHRAFAYYEEANRLQAALIPYDEAGWFHFFDRLEAVCTAELIARLQQPPQVGLMPIFVLGMPRSGTSLVEQVLASHSAVQGAGEVNIISEIAEKHLPRLAGKPYPDALEALAPQALAPFAVQYIQKLGGYAEGASAFMIDKTPINYCHIGLIRMLFPRAPIIHCVRDPMDTCWSLFRQYFPGGHPYRQTLRSLGRYYVRYQKLMRHWHHILPGQIHEIAYEQLIEAPDVHIRALLEYCRLPWEDGCLAFHRTQRAVTTASAKQVRQPLYKTSLKSWEPVAQELTPLREALGEGM